MRLAKIIAVVVAMGVSLNACGSTSSNVENEIGTIVFAPIAAPIGLTMRAIYRAFRPSVTGEAKPPSTDIRDGMDRITVRVFSEVDPSSYATGIVERSDATIDQTAVDKLGKTLREAEPVIALRNRIIGTIQQNTSSKIVDDKEPTGSYELGGVSPKASLILGIAITDFLFKHVSSDLKLYFKVRAEIYDVPEIGSLYHRAWQLDTNLGEIRAVDGEKAADIEKEIEFSIQNMASAIVDDIFISEETENIHPYSLTNGKVVTSFAWGTDALSASKIHQELIKDAICGDTDAQFRLGKSYAAVDPRVYGWRARQSWIKAYKWLRLAERTSPIVAPRAASSIRELEKKLTPEEITSAKELVAEFNSLKCGEELDEKTQTARIASSDPAAATQRGSSQSSIATPLAHARNKPPRKSREEIERYWRERIEAVKREGPHKDCELVIDSPSMNPADFSTCEERAETIERLQKERARELAS